MNSVLRIVLGIICLLVAVIFIFNIMLGDIKPVESQTEGDSIEMMQPQSSQADVSAKSYIVRSYNNNVAVFKEGDAEPYKIFDTDIRILPKVDQVRLEKGIKVTNDLDLKRLLQDYTG